MRSAAAIFTLSLFAAPSAFAASRGHMNRCSDATREVRGATQMVFADRAIEPKEVQSAISHINQHTERYNRAKGMMDSAGPWDAKGPDLSECGELLSKEKAYIDSTITKIKAAQLAGEKQAPVMKAAAGNDNREALMMLAALTVNPKGRVFDSQEPAQAKSIVDRLAPVESACKAAMPEAMNEMPATPTQGGGGGEYRSGGVVLPATLTDRADWWCWVSSHRMDLAAKALSNVPVMAERYGNHHYVFPEILKTGDAWSGSTEGWVLDIYRDEKPFMTGLNKAVGEWYAAFALAVPEQPFPGLSEQITAIRAAVDGAARRNRIEPSSAHDKSMEAGAKSAVSKLYSKVTPVAAWMDANNWTIEQNSLGYPTGRFRSGQVVYRVASDPFCLQRTFNYVEPHMGGGKYQSAAAAGLIGGVKIVKCP